MREAAKRRWSSQEERDAQARRSLGNKNGSGNKGKKHEGEQLEILRGNMSNARRSAQTPETKERRAKSLARAQYKPTGPERRVHAWLD